MIRNIKVSWVNNLIKSLFNRHLTYKSSCHCFSTNQTRDFATEYED